MGICFTVLLTACTQAVSKTVWHIPLLCVQWKSPDNGQRNCLKHVHFHVKNKFEKLVHLVGFIIRNLLRSTITWTSNKKLKYTGTVKLHLFGLNGKTGHQDLQKLRINGFFFQNRLHWQLQVRLFPQHVPAPKSFDHAWFEVLEAITQYCTWPDNR